MTSSKDISSSSRDVSSSSRDTHDDPIPTPYEMSQYIDRALASVPSIRSRTDRVSDFLWYPNAEHSILEAATGVNFKLVIFIKKLITSFVSINIELTR